MQCSCTVQVLGYFVRNIITGYYTVFKSAVENTFPKACMYNVQYVWLPWRGAVQYPQYPGGVTAAVISQSKLFIFYHVIFYSFQPHSHAQE